MMKRRAQSGRGACRLVTLALSAVLVGAIPTSDAGYAGGLEMDPCVAGLLGDVVEDDGVDVGDAQQILRVAASLEPANAQIEARMSTHADVNSDGVVDVGDAQQVLRYAASLSVAYPIGEGMCTITVNTSSSGTNVDADGYLIEVDGAPAGNIDATGSVDVGHFDVGSYTVSLDDVAGNCTVTGGSSQPVDIVEGVVASVMFEISCSGDAVGTLTINNVTGGSNLPTQDYLISLDSGAERQMPVNGGADLFTNVESGSHTVEITNLPGNCVANGGNPRTFSVDYSVSDHFTHQIGITCT